MRAVSESEHLPQPARSGNRRFRARGAYMDRQHRPIWTRDTPLPRCSETAKKSAKPGKENGKSDQQQAKAEAIKAALAV
jgi:hypothetical protein